MQWEGKTSSEHKRRGRRLDLEREISEQFFRWCNRAWSWCRLEGLVEMWGWGGVEAKGLGVESWGIPILWRFLPSPEWGGEGERVCESVIKLSRAWQVEPRMCLWQQLGLKPVPWDWARVFKEGQSSYVSGPTAGDMGRQVLPSYACKSILH
jgi:hypothetical protein